MRFYLYYTNCNYISLVITNYLHLKLVKFNCYKFKNVRGSHDKMLTDICRPTIHNNRNIDRQTKALQYCLKVNKTLI